MTEPPRRWNSPATLAFCFSRSREEQVGFFAAVVRGSSERVVASAIGGVFGVGDRGAALVFSGPAAFAALAIAGAAAAFFGGDGRRAPFFIPAR